MPMFPIPLISAAPSSVPRKAPWKSKTLWVNALIAALMLYPKTAAVVSQYPSAVMVSVAAFNFLLRLATHGKISMEE